MKTEQEIREQLDALNSLQADSNIILHDRTLGWFEALRWVLRPTKQPPVRKHTGEFGVQEGVRWIRTKQPPVWEDMGGLIEDCPPVPHRWTLHLPTDLPREGEVPSPECCYRWTSKPIMDPEEEEWRVWEEKREHERRMHRSALEAIQEAKQRAFDGTFKAVNGGVDSPLEKARQVAALIKNFSMLRDIDGGTFGGDEARAVYWGARGV